MKLFLPSARAAIWLLLIGACALGCAFYLRYQVIENSAVGLACGANPDGSLCAIRRLTIALFSRTVFGVTALVVALLNLLRPALLFFAVALATAAFGIVLYNVWLASLATGLLALSFARRAVEPK